MIQPTNAPQECNRSYLVDGCSISELYDVCGHLEDRTVINAGKLFINFPSEESAAEFELRCASSRLDVIRKIERFE